MTDRELLEKAMKALDIFAGAMDKARNRYAARYKYDVDLGFANFDKMPDDWPMEALRFSMGNLRQARTTHQQIKERLEKP